MLGDSKQSITVTLAGRAELEHQLDAAVARLHEPARKLNRGILETRRSAESFTVCLSEDVPYGIIVENVTW